MEAAATLSQSSGRFWMPQPHVISPDSPADAACACPGGAGVPAVLPQHMGCIAPVVTTVHCSCCCRPRGTLRPR